MAAISLSGSSYQGNFSETVTSSGTTTRWLATPKWARYMVIFLQPTAVTTSFIPSFLAADPVSMDDSNVILLAESAAATPITGTTSFVFQFGPGVTGIADDVTNAAAADSYVSYNVVLPPILGVRTVSTGATTYNITVMFRV